MKAILQQVTYADIHITDEGIDETRKISNGLVLYLGIGKYDLEDYESRIDSFLDRFSKLRLLDDENDRLNATLHDVDGEILIVSNFTLYANYKKGTKMDFSLSAKYADAKKIYDYFVQKAMLHFPGKIQTGKFGAKMMITSEVSGPVNYTLEF